MAAPAPAQSPLRRWKPFFGAFDSVDAIIEASDPVLSRREFRGFRVDLFEMLCNVADDDHAEAERLCLVLDGLMAESLETLRLIQAMPTVLATTDLAKSLRLIQAMPTVLATTDLAKSLRALRKHESERVRVLASGIVSGWRASMQDDLAKVTEAMHKLDKEEEIVDQQPSTKQTSKTSKKTATIVGNDRVKTAKIAARPPLHKKTVEITKKKASDPAIGDVHHAELCSEEKMEAAKRKFQDAYKESEDAKRQRRTQRVVESPEMLKQRQKMSPVPREKSKSRARCA